MNKEKIKEKVYLTGRLKEQIILNKEEKALSPTEISEIILETILRILIREYFKSNTQQNFTIAKNKDLPNNYVKNNEQRVPVK